MGRPKNVHHTLALAEQIIGDDAPMTSPPDGLGAHDRAPVLAAQFPQSRKACSEGLRQSIVGIVPEAADSPIGVWGRFAAARLSAKAAKFRDMIVADLPRRQRLREAVAIELRIGARSRHRPHIYDEIDARLPQQIGEFGDRPGGMTYGEEGVRVGSSGIMSTGQRCRIAPDLWLKLHCFNPGFKRMIGAKSPVCDASKIGSAPRCAEILMKDKFKIGDHVSWNSEAGRVSGTIIRVHTRNFDVNGYTHHASAEAPQYQIKSSKTEHIAFHKGSALTRLRD
jgi:hypothetical protein